MSERRNVREQITLTDTVLVSKYVRQLADRPQGWFATFGEFGSAGSFSFFDTRNRSIGIFYNNQDARDQLPFAMRIMSIGIKFFGPGCASQFTACLNMGTTNAQREPFDEESVTDPTFVQLANREELHSGVWEADLPNHCAATLRTNQDIRLRAPCTMLVPGYGPVGGGWGWGSNAEYFTAAKGGTPTPNFSGETGPPNAGAFQANLQTMQQGEVDLRQRFPVPITMDVPRRANLSLTVSLSQYAKEMFQAIPGPFWHPLPNVLTAQQSSGSFLTHSVKAATFGVQATIHGERLVQQRGDYHV